MAEPTMPGMSDHVAKRLGQRMRALRLAQGLTQAQVGERAGFSGKYINEIEAGRRPDLPLSTLLAIVESGLGAGLAEVFSGETKRRSTRVDPRLPTKVETLAHELARLPPAKRKAVIAVLRATINAMD